MVAMMGHSVGGIQLIKFHSTVEYGNADALSRLPLQEGGNEQSSETRMCNIRQIEMLPLSSQEIMRATRQDPILSKVLSYFLRGWPVHVSKALQSFHLKIAEFSVEEGCLLLGGYVAIPQRLASACFQGFNLTT